MKFDIIITIIDLMSKIAYFIPIYTIVKMEEVTRLFLHYV